jgi:hypothetical protein
LRDDPVAQQPVLGVEHGDPEDLVLEVLHERREGRVDVGGRRQHDTRPRRPRAQPSRELEGGHEARRLGGAHAGEPGQLGGLASGHVGERAVGGEHLTGDVDGVPARPAGAELQREQLGVGEGGGAVPA